MTATRSTGDVAFAAAVSIAGGLKLSGALNPALITVSQNDYEPTGFLTSNFIRVSANAGLSITGLGRDGAGHFKVLTNAGSNAITLVHESASSTANKRFALKGGANYSFAAAESVVIFYDGSSDRWRVLGV